MPNSAKKSKKCTLDMLPEVDAEAKSKKRRRRKAPPKLISLFEQKRARGFWPCYRRDDQGRRELTVRILYYPAKARDYVFTGVGLSVCLSVCLFVTTITK